MKVHGDSEFTHTATGLLSLEQLAAQAKTIADAVRVPVIADAESGFVPEETIRLFEQAGVAAVHIEDHTGAGKHTSGPQQLTSREETPSASARP